MRRILVIGLLLIGLAQSAVSAAAAVEDGLAAYRRGDYAGALRLLRPHARQGDPSAQFHLGLMYEFGDGVASDDAVAAEWYRKAAEQGLSDAQYNVAVLTYVGKGVARDHGQAAEWFRRAAEQGNAFAQNNLATMYSGGQGAARDLVLAHLWFDLAAAEIPMSRAFRDRLARRMSAAKIAEARRLAREWRARRP